MNKRSFELAKQADLIQWDTLPSGAKTPDHESVVKTKKFAELIVKECASIYDKIDNGNKHLDTDHYPEAIYKHFGVEQ
jgi:hypothetical protein